jgi:hypothetical protein
MPATECLPPCLPPCLPNIQPALPCVPPPNFPNPSCRVKGKAVDDVLTIKNSDIAKHLSLPPVKLHCSMLAEDAIKAAVKDWKAKNGKKAQQQQAATA